ncbi:MAG: hypothetical protein VB064_03120 [Oscillospiraceae bacterium]|nr:hypothetical protein [Oscillospiraceae bacterium]
MLDLGALRLAVVVDSKDANKELDNFGENTEKTESKLKQFASSISGKVAIGMTALGAGIGIAGKKLYDMAKESAATTDRIDKLSNKIGISKQGFQEWDYVLAQNGASIEGMQIGLKTLTNLMDGAANGNTAAAETFKKLNLTWEDGNGKLKSQEDMMNEAIYALASMENGTEKAKLATELFGKAGTELMPMLNNGAEGIDQLKNRAHELGLVMSDDAVGAGVLLGDTIDDVTKSFKAIVTQIGIKVMPVVQTMLEWVLSNMPQIQATCNVVFDALAAGVQWVVDFIYKLIDTYKIWESNNKSTVEAIKKVFQIAIDFIKTIFSAFAKVLTGDWEGLWNDIKKLLQLGWDAIVALIPILIDLFIGVFTGAWELFKNVGKDIFNWVWDGLKDIWSDICSWVQDKVDWLVDKLAFWKKGSKQMGGNTDGSHRTGLRQVPYDGYVAELHKGEMILTNGEARQYNKNAVSTGETNITVNNYSPDALSAADTARLFKNTQLELQYGF